MMETYTVLHLYSLKYGQNDMNSNPENLGGVLLTSRCSNVRIALSLLLPLVVACRFCKTDNR